MFLTRRITILLLQATGEVRWSIELGHLNLHPCFQSCCLCCFTLGYQVLQYFWKISILQSFPSLIGTPTTPLPSPLALSKSSHQIPRSIDCKTQFLLSSWWYPLSWSLDFQKYIESLVSLKPWSRTRLQPAYQQTATPENQANSLHIWVEDYQK